MAKLRPIIALVTLASVSWISGVATAAGAEIALNGHVFTLPEEFDIELVAKAPIVNRPITAAFDEEGHLYVSDSSGSNDPVEKQLVERPHRILRLTDTDGDGRFDRQTVFADKMMFPEGTMWLDGSLYVSAAPTIWKLTDTDGDGVADRRDAWLTRTLTTCGNDLHGPSAGPDGWIYWCKGAFAEQSYEPPGKKKVLTRASHIFRARRDGSGLEPVMTGGMENPVDVVFTSGGERIFSTTFLTRPRNGNRDGLIHAIYGGVYGKMHWSLAGEKRTGELLPPLVHLGPAAPSGVTRYESGAFGPGYRDNLFTCCFNMRKLTRHVLVPAGATFQAATSDFLVSNSPDFHPTDVVEDADGSLIVIDTGGWYKICCPSSQLWKPDILGAIYRVRRRTAPKIDDPRGLALAWRDTSPAALTGRLADPRPVVRQRAIEELAKRSDASVPVLETCLKTSDVDIRRNAVWALTRIDRPSARRAVRTALDDSDEIVRQAAIHSASVWRDRLAVPQLVRLLRTESPHNERAAAEALGRIGDRSAVAPLLDTAGRTGPSKPDRSGDHPPDRILEHSLIFALIEIDDPQSVRPALESTNASIRRAALIALDQMDGSGDGSGRGGGGGGGGGLQPEKVALLMSSKNRLIKETASWIVGNHADWGEALCGSLRDRLRMRAGEQSADDRAELERQLQQFAANSSVQELMATALADKSLSTATHRLVLQSMQGAPLRKTPQSWVKAAASVLRDPQSPLISDAVATVRALSIPEKRRAAIARALVAVADDRRTSDAVRLEALAAVPGGLQQVTTETFHFLEAHLNPDLPVATRMAAAEVLSHARLTSDELSRLTGSLKSAGPLEIDRLLAAFQNCRDEAIGFKLIAALKQSPVLPALRVNWVQQRIKQQPPAVQARAEELYRMINADIVRQRQRIEEVLPLARHGSVRHGQAIFAGSKIGCLACHSFGSIGGHIGPDLTKIGAIRSERDLLEAIMFPSASFVRSFEPVQIVTKSGKVYNGLVQKEAADEIVLITSATETVHVAGDEIEERHPGTVSIMPAGLDRQLSSQELADLVAFLKHAVSKNVQ